MNYTEYLSLRVGDKVTYLPDHEGAIPGRGMVKEIPSSIKDYVRVVYYCADNWDNYAAYTSALTRISNLTIGWQS